MRIYLILLSLRINKVSFFQNNFVFTASSARKRNLFPKQDILGYDFLAVVIIMSHLKEFTEKITIYYTFKVHLSRKANLSAAIGNQQHVKSVWVQSSHTASDHNMDSGGAPLIFLLFIISSPSCSINFFLLLPLSHSLVC